MADVFLSYAREDRAYAEKVARALNAMGLDTFWDTDIPPGKTWADYIESKLSGCHAVVVLWSQHSTKSQWVREEARMGRDSGKLIPALIDGAPAPFGFGEVQAADLSTWRGEGNHPEWTRFASAVRQAAGGSAASTAAPPPQPPPRATAAPLSFSATTPAHALSMSPIDYVKKCLRLYMDGKGRARRAEYWWWALACGAVAFIAAVLDAMLFGVNTMTSEPNMQVFSGIAGLAILAPSISVMSRRFHDVGLNGWLVAAVFGAYMVGGAVSIENNDYGALIIVLAALAAIVVTVLPSKPGDNQYGPNPKGL